MLLVDLKPLFLAIEIEFRSVFKFANWLEVVL